MYEYRATVVGNVDGDTIHVTIDLGLEVTVTTTLRFAGINAPEKSTTAGMVAAGVVAEKIPKGTAVRIRTAKDHQEKYGRYLAWIFPDGIPPSGTSLNRWLVDNGYAVPYGPLPVDPPAVVA
jgi:endonuclease YncB( thermonuclease family)